MYYLCNVGREHSAGPGDPGAGSNPDAAQDGGVHLRGVHVGNLEDTTT